jgi:uncharacterized protein YoxC
VPSPIILLPFISIALVAVFWIIYVYNFKTQSRKDLKEIRETLEELKKCIGG